MAITHITEPPAMIHAIHAENWKGSRLGTPEEDSQAYLTFEEDATSRNLDAADILIVHYKPTENREAKMKRDHIVQIHVSKTLSEDWLTEIQVADEYKPYCKEFIAILFDSQSVKDGHIRQ